MRLLVLSTVALAFTVSGCASPDGASRELRQAAPAYAPPPARAPGPVRMGNTYRPAGVGLYGAGEAAPHAEELPRSPNERVLPPTAEPGLWAADEPQAVRRKSPDLPPRTVDELLAATPSPGAPAAPGCRQRLLRASQAAGKEDMRRNLPQSARDCVNARLLLHCLLTDANELDSLARNTPIVDGVDHRLEHERQLEAAQLWQLRLCRDVTVLLPFERLVSDVINAYARRARGAGK